MEIIIAVIVVAAVLFFVMNNNKTAREQQMIYQSLDNDSAFVMYKEQILKVSPYEQETLYDSLYSKISSMTNLYIDNHADILIDGDAVRKIKQKPEDYLEIEDGKYEIKRSLDIKQVDSDTLLALAIFSFMGNKSINDVIVSHNRFFCNRSIEFLVCERKYWQAILAKALIIKYGIAPYVAPDINQSIQLFQSLNSKYSKSADEIIDCKRFFHFSQLKTVHDWGVHSTRWESYDDIESRVKNWHPMNINRN